MKRRKTVPPRDPYRTRDSYRDSYGYGDRAGGDRAGGDRAPAAPASGGVKGWLNYTTLAVLAGVFILGIGIGIGFSSTASVDPQNVASREFLDRAAPNAEYCVQYGASSIAMDARIFVTLSPFNVYVSQPRMQPGCVVRSNNWSLLEQQGVVSSDDVRDCKRRMNTFAFTGDVKGSPRIDCVYQNDAAGNLFLDRDDRLRRESEQF